MDQIFFALIGVVMVGFSFIPLTWDSYNFGEAVFNKVSAAVIFACGALLIYPLVAA